MIFWSLNSNDIFLCLYILFWSCWARDKFIRFLRSSRFLFKGRIAAWIIEQPRPFNDDDQFYWFLKRFSKSQLVFSGQICDFFFVFAGNEISRESRWRCPGSSLTIFFCLSLRSRPEKKKDIKNIIGLVRTKLSGGQIFLSRK